MYSRFTMNSSYGTTVVQIVTLSSRRRQRKGDTLLEID